MDNYEFISRLRCPEELIGFFHRRFRQVEVNSAKWIADSQWLKQGEVVVNCMKEANRRFHEFGVATSPYFCPQVRMIRGDSLSGMGKKGQKSRAIVAGEIE